jgi:hypothetical protein
VGRGMGGNTLLTSTRVEPPQRWNGEGETAPPKSEFILAAGFHSRGFD